MANTNVNAVREFLEKHYTDDVAASDEQTIKLAIRALLEVCPPYPWQRARGGGRVAE